MKMYSDANMHTINMAKRQKTEKRRQVKEKQRECRKIIIQKKPNQKRRVYDTEIKGEKTLWVLDECLRLPTHHQCRAIPTCSGAGRKRGMEW